jgi:hypothetical protein
LELITHVTESKLTFLNIFNHLFLFVFGYGVFDSFHKPAQVTQAKESLNKPRGLKWLKIFEMLARSNEYDG